MKNKTLFYHRGFNIQLEGKKFMQCDIRSVKAEMWTIQQKKTGRKEMYWGRGFTMGDTRDFLTLVQYDCRMTVGCN